jgi:nitrite reductase/ring-hydroxylating ferredoxin subunit
MSEWHQVVEDTVLEDGQMREITVDGMPMLIARVEGQFYATQARCPHMGGRLAHGKLDGHIVACPRHGSRFDVRDGRNLDWIPGLPSLVRGVAKTVSKPADLTVYATHIRDGQLWVETKE